MLFILKKECYVYLTTHNLYIGEEQNFEKYSHLESDILDIEYDYTTIMHYGRMAFSKNQRPTMQAIGKKDMALGQSKSLNEFDIIQINALYDCKSMSFLSHMDYIYLVFIKRQYHSSFLSLLLFKAHLCGFLGANKNCKDG